jgi:signal transduction histidine kinase
MDDAARDKQRFEQLTETGRQVFQSLPLGLVVFDRDLGIIHHNPASDFLVADHASIDEALSRQTVDAHYQEWRPILRDVVDNGRERRFEKILHRDARQSERILNLTCFPLMNQAGDRAGGITGGTLIIEDVTATAGMEQRLAVSERMAAVGKLAARVAHELNNPIDGILRYLNLALRALEMNSTDRITNYLTQARGGILRMSEIVRQLVHFSRSTHVIFDGAGINAVIEESVNVMMEKASEAGVSIVSNLDRSVPATGATNLFQVFCNLIKNAIDAMPGGGTLTISTKVSDQAIVLTFADTGVGLPEEMDRIFEPFFTTKDHGKGTGLGLAISKDIIEKCGGAIAPRRRESGGTEFTITLPVDEHLGLQADRPSSLSIASRSRFTSPESPLETHEDRS